MKQPVAIERPIVPPALTSPNGPVPREPVTRTPVREPVQIGRWARVPGELKERAQWVNWRLEQRDGKPTKVPYNARTRREASVTDPSARSTHEQVVAASGNYSGIGFVLTADDPYVGVDLDHCIDDDGVIAPWAQEIVDPLRSYTEITPSRHGLRIFVRGALPPGRRKKGNVEMYSEARYLTVTGDHLPGTPPTIEDRTSELLAVHTRVFAEPVATDGHGQPAAASAPEDADRALLVRALKDEKFARPFLGDVSGYGGDDSVADMALCAKLAFWTGKNPQQMDRLFRMSGLMREKWTKRRGEHTYGEMTIAKAIDGCTRVYAPEQEPHLAPIAELLNQPDEEHRWVVQDRMPTKGVVLFVSKPKVGKTTTLRALVAAVAQGKPWLCFDTLRGSVAYIDFDGKPGEVKAHFKKLGVTDADPIKQYIGRSPKDAVAWLRREAEREPFVMIAIDNLQKLVRVQDARAYAEAVLAMEPIEAIAREIGVLLVVTWHSPKTPRGEDVVDAVLESTGFAGSVDNIFEIKRYGAARTIRSTQRIGSDLEEIVVTYDEATGVVTSGPPWREAQRRRLGDAILEFLRTQPSAVDEPTIMEQVEGNHAIKRRALRREVNEGRVLKLGHGKRGNPFMYVVARKEPVRDRREVRREPVP